MYKQRNGWGAFGFITKNNPCKVIESLQGLKLGNGVSYVSLLGEIFLVDLLSIPKPKIAPQIPPTICAN